MKKLSVLFMSVFLISGCASFNNYMAAQMCNENAAYAAGVNDAKNYQDMRSNYASFCAPADKDQMNTAYRKGYLYMMKRLGRQYPYGY